jgi:hypothetical protein
MKKITLPIKVPICNSDVSAFIVEYMSIHTKKAQSKFACDIVCVLISSVYDIDSKEEALTIIKNMQKTLNLLENKFNK